MGHQYKSPLIRQDFGGTYCLGFLNSHGLDIEEIRTIFSAFGEVLTIKEAGDKTGYRFVRYQYADEAENAVDGLKMHSKIRLVEHRPKSNKKPENQKNKKFNENKNENKFQSDNGHYNRNNKNFNDNFEEGNRNSNGHNKEIDQNDDEIDVETNQNVEKIYKENQSENNKNFNISSTKVNSSNENLLHNAKSCNSLNSVLNNDVIKHKVNSLTSSVSDESLYVEDDCDKIDIPDLVKSEKLKIPNNVPKKTILKAEEIIVGNIPNDFGSAFILHLFECYNPIAISHINFVKNSTIRYCHVYFKSIQDSINVENTFDRMHLSGQRLLVVRPCHLVQEAVY